MLLSYNNNSTVFLPLHIIFVLKFCYATWVLVKYQVSSQVWEMCLFAATPSLTDVSLCMTSE